MEYARIATHWQILLRIMQDECKKRILYPGHSLINQKGGYKDINNNIN